MRALCKRALRWWLAEASSPAGHGNTRTFICEEFVRGSLWRYMTNVNLIEIYYDDGAKPEISVSAIRHQNKNIN